MGPFPYFPLAFTKDGTIADQSQFAAAIAAIAPRERRRSAISS